MKSIIALLFCLTTVFSCVSEAETYVLVSVAPHKFFVEKIAGDTLKVELMVPAGASSHTFEPTPKQMMKASNADMWFQIGESFEPRASQALLSHNPKLQLVNLRNGLDLIVSKNGEEGHCKCCHSSSNKNDYCVDPHFWLSARQAKIQAATIADALSQRYPEHKTLYETNLKKFQKELDDLDQEIQTILKPLKNRLIMVSHPAYAYFCRDYDLKQLSIEFEGKDPTPQQLTKTINTARDAHITKIFIQMQYNNKGARLIAKQIGAEVVTLDPYAENYIETMRDIARNFAQ